MSDFTAGLALRIDAAAQALHAAFALEATNDFAPADIRRSARGPVSFAPEKPRGFAPAEQPVWAEPAVATEPEAPARPKSFSPADREADPTAGWDPFAAVVEPEQSFIDQIAAAHAAGYAEGVAAAIAEGKARDAEGAALLARLGEALRTESRIDRARLAEQLRQTVLLLVTKIVGETGVSAELLAGRVETATDLLAESAESALLRLNPEDVALTEGRLPTSVFAAGDASVPRGSFVLESASTIVEDGPALWLEQLAAAVDRVALPC
jgi:flagellar assembly protein FliH